MPVSASPPSTGTRPKQTIAPTINQAFRDTVRRFPDSPALAYKKDKAFESITYADLEREVRVLASGLVNLGVRHGDRLAIIAENGVDWVKADLAALSIGAATAPIYPTLPANQVEYILRDSGASLVFAGDKNQLLKVLAVRQQTPDLKHVVAFEESPGGDVLTLDGLRESGQREPLSDAEYERRWSAVRPDDLLTLIYTSGTTGDPKGVELSHANIVAAIDGSQALIHWDEHDTFLSLLPLSHIYERALGYYLPLTGASRVAYVEGKSMVERLAKLPANFVEVQPTIFLGMPRLYEKMREKIEDNARKAGAKKYQIFQWAVTVGRQAAYRRMRGMKPGPVLSMKVAVADRLVFQKIRARTGGAIRYLVSAGAPLNPDIMEFFHACGLPIIEGYGLTETSSLVTGNRPGATRPGSVGQASPNTEVRLGEDGEVICRGPNVMRRYWNKPDATAEVLTPDGWFHTGDLGEWVDGSFLKITGRKKDLLVLSNGKKVAPQNIEAALMLSPYIHDVVLMGDGTHSVVALIIPVFERLESEFGKRDHAELAADPAVKKLYKAELDRLSAGLADFERVRRFAILDHELTIESGELTPSLKVKRHVMAEKYKDLLAELTG